MILKLIVPVFVYLIFFSAAAQSSDWALSDGQFVNSLDVEIDNDGNLITLGFIYGAFGKVDIDPGTGEFILESFTSDWPQFLRKIDSKGELVWIVLLDSDFAEIELDDANNIYLMTSFNLEFDADPTSGTQIFNADPLNENIFYTNIALTKLDTTGVFLWAKQITQGGDSGLSGFELLNGGDICVIGTFRDSVDFDSGTGEHIIGSSFNLEYDGFLLRLDSAGNFKWMANFDALQPESTVDVVSSLEDFMGNIYINGRYYGAVDFDTTLPGSELTEDSMGAHFIAKYDSLGNFIWVKENGKDYFNRDNMLYDSDQFGNIYIGGKFENTKDFSPSAGTYNVTSAGGSDIFIQKIDSLGNLVWLKQFGGADSDQLGGLTLDADGNIYHYGVFEGNADLDPGGGTISLTAYGNGFYEELSGGSGMPDAYTVVPAADTYIQKINSLGIMEWTGQIGGKYDDYSGRILFDDGYIIIDGAYSGSVDFRPGPDSLFMQNPSPNMNYVIVKLTPPLEGLTQIYAKSEPVFYPNPVSSVLYIGTGLLYDTYEVRLINTNGDVVFQQCCISEKSAIGIDHLAAGVYILYLYNEDENHQFKIVVAR